MQKMGSFGAVKGQSRSSAMSPFDRAHTTSYSTLIETMRTLRARVRHHVAATVLLLCFI